MSPPRGQHRLSLCTHSTGRLIYRTKIAALQRWVLFSLGLSVSLVFQRWTELDLIKRFCWWEKPSLPHPRFWLCTMLIPAKVLDRHQCEATCTQSLSTCQNQHCCTQSSRTLRFYFGKVLWVFFFLFCESPLLFTVSKFEVNVFSTAHILPV